MRPIAAMDLGLSRAMSPFCWPASRYPAPSPRTCWSMARGRSTWMGVGLGLVIRSVVERIARGIMWIRRAPVSPLTRGSVTASEKSLLSRPAAGPRTSYTTARRKCWRCFLRRRAERTQRAAVASATMAGTVKPSATRPEGRTQDPPPATFTQPKRPAPSVN